MSETYISIIVPIFNEEENIVPLVCAIEKTLLHYSWEVIFVDDDSPDGTMDTIRQLSHDNPRVRGLHRVGRKGLSSAVIEGALLSSSPLIAVMDGDLQHDETCLIPMLHTLETGHYDLIIASRYITGGKDIGLANSWRRFLSRIGRWIICCLLKTSLSDPMSGFFIIRREHLEHRLHNLSGKGFKILLDLILADPTPLRIAEVPMIFRKRLHGESKLGWKIILSFASMLLHHAYRKNHTP